LAERSALQVEAILELQKFVSEPHIFRWTRSFSSRKVSWLWKALSPIISNIFMEHFEKFTLDSAQYKPSLWLQYVDDIFVVWPHA
jgi:hypothetical protein